MDSLIYTCLAGYIHIYVWLTIYVCMYYISCICIHEHVNQAFVKHEARVDVCMCVHEYVHANISICKQICVYMHTDTCIQIYTD